MERDGITKVYITSAAHDAWEVFPEEKPYEQRLQGAAAEEVLERTDFRAVSVERFEIGKGGVFSRLLERKWGVHLKPDGERFEIDRMGLKHEEEYPQLAVILEQRTGKNGLTVVVS